MKSRLTASLFFLNVVAATVCAAEPPAGFVSLFDGQTLSGWRGRPHLDPQEDAKGTPEEQRLRQAVWNRDLASHWSVEDGVITSDGQGVFLTTNRDYSDFELLIEWMLPLACADSGIYLRANPQVQIWDPDCTRDFPHGCQKGSGALWNNAPESAGKFPLVKADKPTGQWNAAKIWMQGNRVSVILNDQLVVDNQVLANFFAKGAALPITGPIQIQTHGAPMKVRNVFIRELSSLDGSGPGWRDLNEDDFTNVNCNPDTWTWQDGTAHCTGQPVGVIRTKEPVADLEMALEWRHLSAGGNSGVFLWSPPQAIEGLLPGTLPRGGIEVQVLDHGYTAQYEKSSGKKADWFTTHGDVFPVGTSTMKPFAPVSPDGTRSFPKGKHSRGTPDWNRYFIRAIGGEVRLWVNGQEVSGGSGCTPSTGFLCLESEGAPVEFRRLRVRPVSDAQSVRSSDTPTSAANKHGTDDDAGFISLFDGTSLTGWQGDVDGYEVANGELRCRRGGGGNLLTQTEYDDFVLRFDFRLTPGANNGLAIRAPANGDAAFAGMELQILDDSHPKYSNLQPWQSHGSIYGVMPAKRDCLQPAGEWNSEEVTVSGSKIAVVVNGKAIMDADIAAFRNGQPTPDGMAHPGLNRTKGHIAFLGHGDEVHFRRIRIRPNESK